MLQSVVWQQTAEGVPAPYFVDEDGVPIEGDQPGFAPQPGGQQAFLECDTRECLFEGNRGGGKTYALIADFLKDVGRGFGSDWRGILFRQTYEQHNDVILKSKELIGKLWPAAKFNEVKFRWTFPDGEILWLRRMLRMQDYTHYHGHQYAWIGWEELTEWADDRLYLKMFGTNRSPNPQVAPIRRIRATCNPSGVGHHWVKARFQLPILNDDVVGPIIREFDDEGDALPERCAIHSHREENRVLMDANPDYLATLRATSTNPAELAAWIHGDWNIVAGGMFSDVWNPARNVLPDFTVPDTWKIDRTFDWGSSAPFAVGWYAQSDGSDLLLSDGRVISTRPGDLFRLREYYGWNGRPNQGIYALATDVARGIVEREIMWGWRDPKTPHLCRVRPGPADTSIWTVENGIQIANDMEQPVRIDSVIYPGPTFTRADKSPGSLKPGWEVMRRMMAAATPRDGMPRERPGLFVVGEYNPQFLRTVITLPRDKDDLDKVAEDSENHIADEVRYRCRALGNVGQTGATAGYF